MTFVKIDMAKCLKIWGDSINTRIGTEQNRTGFQRSGIPIFQIRLKSVGHLPPAPLGPSALDDIFKMFYLDTTIKLIVQLIR